MRLMLLFACGLAFGVGLAVSGMAHPEIVLSFLMLEDLGLLLTMGAALAVSGSAYAIARRSRRKPVMGGAYDEFPKTFSRDPWIGGAIFGVGWGLSGVCPGAAFASIGTGNAMILLAIASMFLGAYLQGVTHDPRRG